MDFTVMDEGLTFSMPVEVYLQAALVRGVLETRHDRVSSHLLVRQEDEVFSLRDASLETLEGKPIASGSNEYIVYMREVYLIADLSPEGRSQRSGLDSFYVKKDTSKALISVGPYLLQGDVYMLPGSELHELLMAKSQFIPMTGATVLGRPPAVRKTYLINRSKIGFMTHITDSLMEL